MRTPSFKLKMLLAMMAVVVGVTTATSVVSERSFQASYRESFIERFHERNLAFSREQQIIVENFKEASERLAALARIQHALGAAPEVLYERVDEDLELQRLSPAPGQSNDLRTTFFAFLDAEGQLIDPPPGARPGLEPFASQMLLRTQIVAAAKALEKLDDSIACLVTPKTESGQAALQQAVFAKVIETSSDEIVGTFVAGFPLPQLVHPNETNRFKAGILFQGQLFSSSIPADQCQRLAEKVSPFIGQPAATNLWVEDEIGGKPHLLFHVALEQPLGLPPATLVALFSLEEALSKQAALRRNTILFGAAGLAAALILSGFLAHGLSVPIRELAAGTAEVQKGNFDVRVTVRSRDEIGRLAASFNEMAEGLALKEKYRSVLNMVADKNVAQELMQGTVVLGGETRIASVLFCDIRGFTSLTQNMDPGEVIRMLNEHFTPLTRVVYEHGGVVDKFVGDLIMAVFGAPRSYGNDALNAVNTAMAMIRERTFLNERSQYQIAVGIGVASGPVVAGCMGSSDRLNYTVLGERVNLASRLCGKAGRMEVIIDETTREIAGPTFPAEPLPDLELKGFSGKVRAYKITSFECDIVHPKNFS